MYLGLTNWSTLLLATLFCLLPCVVCLAELHCSTSTLTLYVCGQQLYVILAFLSNNPRQPQY